MKLRLSWQDPVSGRQRQPLLNLPVALGANFDQMPTRLNGQAVSRMVIADPEVQGFQALLIALEGQLYVIDSPLSSGTFVNRERVQQQQLVRSGDRLHLGQVDIGLQVLLEPGATERSQTCIQPANGQVLSPSGGNGAQLAPPLRALVPPRAMSPATDNPDLALQGCRQRVGFLFTRRCGRLSNQGCPDCRQGHLLQAPDPERGYYEGFGRYQPGDWGYELLQQKGRSGSSPTAG